VHRVYLSTINRVGDSEVRSIFGHLYVLDWDTGELLHDLEQPVETDLSIGRSKGARGIVFSDNRIYVANSVNAITMYDANTYKVLDHKEFDEIVVVHQMNMHQGLLCAVSTTTDSVVRVDKDLNLVSVSKIENRLLDKDLTVDQNAKEWGIDKAHFNSICWLPNGDEIHVYNTFNMIYNFTRKEIIYRGDPLNSPHDIISFRDSLIVNSSANCQTVQIQDNKAKIIFSVPPENIRVVDHNQWGMTRGLTSFKDRLFICYTPMRVLEFKYEDGQFFLEKRVDIDEGENKSIFDICLDPRDWNGD
jgi:hypothetical protein